MNIPLIGYSQIVTLSFLKIQGSFAVHRGEIENENWDAMHANMDILKAGQDILSILKKKAITLILQNWILEKREKKFRTFVKSLIVLVFES